MFLVGHCWQFQPDSFLRYSQDHLCLQEQNIHYKWSSQQAMHEYFSIWTVTDKTIVFHSDSRLLLSLCARRYCAYSKCNLNCKRSKVLRSKTYAFPLNETSVTIYCLTCLQLCTMRAETSWRRLCFQTSLQHFPKE